MSESYATRVRRFRKAREPNPRHDGVAFLLGFAFVLFAEALRIRAGGAPTEGGPGLTQVPAIIAGGIVSMVYWVAVPRDSVVAKWVASLIIVLCAAFNTLTYYGHL